MKILQIGYPKSGNYWLYKIIQESLNIAGIDQKNFIKQHSIYPIAKKWELSYPEQVDINMMDILYPGCFYRISSIFRKRIEDLETYVENNTHIWSHSNYCVSSEQVFPMFDKIIYIIRDPRDVALSKADFAFTPYMQKHYPTWHKSPSVYLKKEAVKIAREWKHHVDGYLAHASRHGIFILFYEQLKENFEQQLKSLLNYLELSLTPADQNRITQNVSSKQLRKQSPQHVRKASYYKWFDDMPPHLIDQITAESKPVLTDLGYPMVGPDKALPEWG